MRFLLLLILPFLCIETYAIDNLIPYRKGNKWGYADSTGTVVVKPIYSSVSHIGSSVCYIVELNGKYGALNSAGKKITALKYDRIEFIQDNTGLIITLNGKMGALDNSGKTLLPCTYDNISYYPIRREIIFQTADKIGYYSIDTKTIVQDQNIDDLAIAEMAVDESDEQVKRYDLRYFVVRSGNKNKIAKETKTITFQNGSPIKTQVSIDTLRDAFDKVFPLNYYEIPAILFSDGGKWGVVYADVVAIPATYDSISPVIINDRCEKFYLQVMQKGKWGIIDTKGQQMVPVAYDEIIHPNLIHESGMSCFNAANGILVRSFKKSGIVTITGETAVPLEQDSIVSTGHNYYTYFQGNRKGIYGASFKSDLIFSHSEQLSGLIDFHGLVLIRVIDNKRLATNIWGSKDPYVVGYVSQTGIRFYEN